MSDQIQSSDLAEAANLATTPDAGEAVAAGSPVPTDKYLSPEDVAATKAADAEAAGTPPVVDPAAPVVAAVAPVVAAKPSVAGAPPEDRWDAILDNARKKARAEVEGEYAWTKELSRDDVEATRKWITLGNQNPMLALDQLVQGMIRSNPDQQPQIERYFRSIMREVAPAAVAAPATTQVDADPMPPPDIPTDTSNGVPVVYSDKQTVLRDAWLTRKIMKEVRADFEKDLGPIRNERAKTAQDAQNTAYSDRAVGAIAGLPGFDEYRAEIAAAYQAIPVSDTTRTEGEKLRDAYTSVVMKKVAEKNEQEVAAARSEAVASVHRRAEAGTVNPSSSSASTPFDYKTASWEQALRHEFNSQALGR